MGKISDEIKDLPLMQKLRYLIFNTKIEVFMGLFAASSLVATLSYRDNKKKEAHMPVALSGIEEIFANFKKEGKTVPYLTQEYAISNDKVMRVFEANNDALAVSSSNETFAKELQKGLDLHENSYPVDAKKITQGALAALHKPISAHRDVNPAVSALQKTWSESHYDKYHTEWYWTTSCSGSGKSRSCHPVRKSRQVYDYTIHSYGYNAEAGMQAARLLKEFAARNPDMKLGERLISATSTTAENENAILKSMIEKFKDKKPTAEDYLQIANTWVTGSTFTKHFPDIVKNHARVKSLATAWEGATWSAKDVSYITHSRYDSGPEEYQIAEAAIKYGIALGKNTKAVTGGIIFAGQKVPELDAKIKDYIDVTLHGKKGDADELRSEIMKTARSIYTANFEKGFDVYPFKWGVVILLTLAGAAIGAAAGLGADKLLDRYEDKRLNKKREDEFAIKRSKIEDLFSTRGTKM